MINLGYVALGKGPSSPPATGCALAALAWWQGGAVRQTREARAGTRGWWSGAGVVLPRRAVPG
jgi:hypothetical protein